MNTHKCNQPAGFALIATISVMVLLVMIALAMLSLSSITLREQRHSGAQDEAKANARMALMIALGELQSQLGPDQRISAPASILDSSQASATIDGVQNPGWLGVWNAQAKGANLTYETGRENSFRSWLVSLPVDKQFNQAGNMALADDDSVILNGPDADDQYVRAGLMDVDGGEGKFAWHVEDNAMRARSNMPLDAPVDIAAMIARRGSAVRHSPQIVMGMEELPIDSAETNKMITSKTIPLTLPVAPANDYWRNALTAQSVSLMTDVVDGGWRKDINTLFEQTNPSDFESLGYGKWEGGSSFSSQDAYLYGPRLALGARWNHLHAYYNLYKRVSFKSGVPQVQPKGKMIDWHLADQRRDFGDSAGGFSFPRIAKIVYVFSYSSKKSPSNPGKYQLQLVTDIFVTLWNPYNTRIVFPQNCCMFIKFSEGIPMRFSWYLNDAPKGSSNLAQIVGKPYGLFKQSRMYKAGNGNLFSMEPGETTVLSPRDSDYYPGAYYTFGHKVGRVLAGRELEGNGTDRISVSLKPDNEDSGFIIGGQRTSQYSDFWIYDNSRGWPYYEHRGEIISQADVPFIQRMDPVDKDDVPSVTFAEVENRKQPFGAFTVELKTASESVQPSMAFLHSGISRLSSRSGGKEGEWNTERMDYRLEPVTSFNSDILQVTVPTHPAGANHGFIGSGRTFATGVTHVMHAGLPVLPMTSLAEFQHAGVGDGSSTLRATHWGFNSTPLPPYMDYAVGNSSAHPLVAKNSKRTGNYYDHSYNANEMLWDHYFCSSLAPQTQSIFNYQREMPMVWNEFLRDNKPMLNPRFRPYLGSKTESDLEEQVFSGGTLKKEAFRSIASHLLYEGGFNVNSTSVEAWKAFLAGSRHDQLRILEAFKPTASAATKTAKGTPFSRTKLPLGGSIDASSSDRQRQYLGYRDLDDDQITELAEKIVEQVKKRGPFLSLGDFVNRQLSSNTEMAKSGALQSAIDESSVNDNVAKTGEKVSGVGKGFNFAEAADGNSAAGSPGWLIQGDILTPLGPSMFVRGDTFTIRSYGDARDAQDNIIARAYCEAVVQRLPDYLDASDEREISLPASSVNKKFGRKFKILQFRWISPEEFS
jgi:hypothetical protein